MTARHPDELDRWMTLERIAFSDLMRMLHDGYLQGEWTDGDEMAELAHAALRCFGNGRCLYLASAVSAVVGLPIAAFWRRDDAAAPLVHAAAVDPLTSLAFDIMGARPLGTMRDELAEAVGPIKIATVSASELGLDAREVEVLLDIAAGMPWMPRTGRAAPPLREWARLVTVYAAAGSRP